jgi:chemotaxis protein CheD
MMKHGARRENLRAKAFGGASMWDKRRGDNFFCVGNVNSRFIQEFLHNEGIPLLTADLEGDRGRVIYFSYGDYAVYVRKMRKTKGLEVVRKERTFWKHSLEAQQKQENEPEIWI